MIISVQWILQSNVDLNSFKVFVFIQKDKMDTNYLLSKVTKNDNKAEIFMFKKKKREERSCMMQLRPDIVK